MKKALAWWEDEDHNPDIDNTRARRKILFEDRIRRRRASLESSIRSSSKSNSNGQSPNIVQDLEKNDRVLPSRLLRKWRKIGRILNIANTLAKLRVKDRYINALLNNYEVFSSDLVLIQKLTETVMILTITMMKIKRLMKKVLMMIAFFLMTAEIPSQFVKLNLLH